MHKILKDKDVATQGSYLPEIKSLNGRKETRLGCPSSCSPVSDSDSVEDEAVVKEERYDRLHL